MNPEHHDDPGQTAAGDEQFLNDLAAIDEALAAGEPPHLREEDTAAAVQQRVARGAACLELLNQHWPRRGDALRDSTQVSEPPTDKVPNQPNANVEIPERLGRFHIQRELGRGGNGVVLLAYDPNLGRDVALKVPSIDVMVNDELRERFFRESRAAAALDHPNIVSVYEAGQIGPVYYIASTYCSGLNLSSWMRSRAEPVAFEVAARLILQLAQAVEHAHSRGVLHRDLKPSNVLLSERVSTSTEPDSAIAWEGPSTEQGPPNAAAIVPRVTDFGLAKLVDADAEETRTGAVFGTPSYMAPEQAAGETNRIGPAADIYALGAILYEMLVGRPPFQGESSLEILIQVRTEEPVALSRLRPRTPRDLETICRKCLEKEPHRRYETAKQLGEDLQRFLSDSPIKARPVGRIERAWRWCRRRPLPASLLLALALTLVCGFSGIYWQWRRAEDRAAEAELERQTANQQRERAEATLLVSVESVDHFFTDVSENLLFDQPGTYELREDLLVRAQGYYEQFLKRNRGNPRLQFELAKARLRVGGIFRRLGRSEDAFLAMEDALKGLKSCAQKMPNDAKCQHALGECEKDLGQILRNRGAIDRSLVHLNNAVARFESLCESQPHDLDCQFFLCASLHELADALTKIDENDAAIEHCRRAQTLLKPLIAAQPTMFRHRSLMMSTYNSIACQQLERSQVTEAIEAFKTGLESVEGFTSSLFVSARCALIHTNLGDAYTRIGQNDEALNAHLEARELLQTLVRQNPAVTEYRISLAATYQNIAIHARRSGKGEESLELYQHAAGLFEQLSVDEPLATDHRHRLAKAKLGKGYALQMVKRPDKAMAAFVEARDIWRQLAVRMPDNAEYQFMSANCCSVIGTLHSRNGATQQAIDAYRQAIQQHEQLLQNRDLNLRVQNALGAVLNDLGLTFFKAKQYNEALVTCQQAIEHQLIALNGAPDVVAHRKHLSNHYSTTARVHQAMGQWESALEMCEQRRRLWRGDGVQLYAASRRMIELATAIETSQAEMPSTLAELRERSVSRAIDTLEEAIDAGFSDWGFFKKDRALDPLRSHPRFVELAEKLKSRAVKHTPRA